MDIPCLPTKIYIVVLITALTTFAWTVHKLLQILDDSTNFLHPISYLQNAIRGSSARNVNIDVRHSCDFLCLLLILETNTDARDFMLFHIGVTLWAQLGELSEEPMPIFEETILMDCVKFVPVLVCPVFIFLWIKNKWKYQAAMFTNHWKKKKKKVQPKYKFISLLFLYWSFETYK